MSKKIADLNLEDSEFINGSLTNLYDEDNDILTNGIDVEDDDFTAATSNPGQITIDDDPIEATNINEEEEGTSDAENDLITNRVENSEVETSFDDYNTLSILALALKEEDPELIDFEIDKDIKPEVLISNLKSKLDKTREQIVEEVSEQFQGAAKYLQAIIEGATEEDLKGALSYNQIASMEITGEEDESQLEAVVKFWLLDRGVPDADDLIEVYKDKGVLVDRTRDAIAYSKQQEDLFFDEWKANRDARILQERQAQLAYQKAVKSYIEKGSIKGLSIKDKKKFEDSLFKPTEVVEFIDNTGRKRLQKVPLINVKMQEFSQDVEQQLAMQLLVLDGFDFTSLVDTAKKKVSSNLINTLNERTNVTNSGKKSSSTYFED